ncbi:DUF3152 domain-containing protein [Streptosporangium subroseum]|uniref:DUF3152 domain-containing protein n=1 Tax=Streptosporangium subroseum TaxID=106412 RepID=UPI003091A3EA|nr:DUF3152 domain-containing protein [Streptosporangium subroseum]
MLWNVQSYDRKSFFWLLAVSISATLVVGGGALLSGHFEPVPSKPAPPVAALPEVSVTPTPPPEPADPAASPNSTAAPGTQKPEEPILLANGRQQPLKVKVPKSAGGRYTVVPGEASPPKGGKGRVIRYLVEVERGLPFDANEFADEVHRILNDRRGWGFRFQRVARGPVEIRVSLSSPTMTNRQCRPLVTFGELSCWNGERAVVNAERWNSGAKGYGRDVATYREYVINHEVGHGLGHGHVSCPGPGKPAPVMVQQTKSLYGCRPNAWPSPRR